MLKVFREGRQKWAAKALLKTATAFSFRHYRRWRRNQAPFDGSQTVTRWYFGSRHRNHDETRPAFVLSGCNLSGIICSNLLVVRRHIFDPQGPVHVHATLSRPNDRQL